MSISDLLLLEFDAEAKTTRTMLERVPEDNKDFTPHPKSMPLNKLAPHVAELAGFGVTVLTTPSSTSRKTAAASALPLSPPASWCGSSTKVQLRFAPR